jgi:hypothetical protein
MKKCLIVAVVVGCFSFVEAKAQDCPGTPVRNLIKKVREVQPVRTVFKKAYDTRPIRTLFKRKPLRSLLKGRSRSASCYKSEQIENSIYPIPAPAIKKLREAQPGRQIENSTVPIPLIPVPAVIPDA